MEGSEPWFVWVSLLIVEGLFKGGVTMKLGGR